MTETDEVPEVFRSGSGWMFQSPRCRTASPAYSSQASALAYWRGHQARCNGRKKS